MENRGYFDSAMCDYQDVLDYDKRVMIVSEGKSRLAYQTIAMLADRGCLQSTCAKLRCEDGELHEHLFVSSPSHPANPSRGYDASERALELVEKAKRGDISRQRLQYDLGHLLGYKMDDILEFIASPLARNCPCDCCGGPFVSEHMYGMT